MHVPSENVLIYAKSCDSSFLTLKKFFVRNIITEKISEAIQWFILSERARAMSAC